MSSSAPQPTHRRSHQQRASAHACPECGADPLIIIFTDPGPDDDDTTYWYDCPHCRFTSRLRAVPSSVDDPSPLVPLERAQIDEAVATIDTEPPF